MQTSKRHIPLIKVTFSIHKKTVLWSEWRHPLCKIIKCCRMNDMKSGQKPRLYNILWKSASTCIKQKRAPLLVRRIIALLWRTLGKENAIHSKWRKISRLCQRPINIKINCSILFGIVTGHSIRHLYANSQSFGLLHAYQLSGPELGCQQDKWWSGSFGRFNCG